MRFLSIIYISLRFGVLGSVAITSFLFSAYVNSAPNDERNIHAFVYTEVQNSVPFDKVPWPDRNPVISSQPGFLFKTWLSGVGNNSVGGFYAFDSIENAQKYVTGFFPNQLKKRGLAHTSRVFNADVVREASHGLSTIAFNDGVAKNPKAFVYTELQVKIPFSEYSWKPINTLLKKQPGFLSGTWLSGVNDSIGFFLAFDSIANAKKFAVETFPLMAANQNAAFYVRVFDSKYTVKASLGMGSPYFTKNGSVANISLE